MYMCNSSHPNIYLNNFSFATCAQAKNQQNSSETFLHVYTLPPGGLCDHNNNNDNITKTCKHVISAIVDLNETSHQSPAKPSHPSQWFLFEFIVFTF